MNILVTGANGQLGMSIRRAAANATDRYLFADINVIPELETIPLDITSPQQISKVVSDNDIDIIVNCAAFTNVDAAEDNMAAATLLNATAPLLMAKELKKRSGLLIHISTDYVFGLEQYNTPCTEEMKGTPSGVYGSTKLEGENNIISSGCDYLIFRTSWLYSEYGRNFCKTMMQLTATKESVSVVFDQAGTPTYAGDLARLIVDVIEKKEYVGNTGIYNFSNEGVCSWYDFAYMVGLLSKHDNCKVLPCHSSEYPSKVVRPSYSVLDKTKVKQTFCLATIPHWTFSLAICINNILKQ